jgi:phosphate transport system substrate-binding protein
MYRLFNRIILSLAVLVAVVTVGSVFGGGSATLPLQVESAQFCPIALKAEGSTTVFPITRASEAPYESLFGPGTDIQLASIGSTNGINLLTAGQVEVAPSSRPLSAGEASGKYVFKVALDAFVIAVKNDPQMSFLDNGITVPQIVQIYTAGAGINGLYWDQLSPPIPGAPHRLIVPRARITGSGSQPDFLSKFGISAAAEAATIDATGLPRQVESSDMAAVAAANLDHISYTSLANLLTPGMKIVKLSDGVGGFIEPTTETVINQTYPRRRELFLAMRDNAVNPRIDNSNFVRADDFINFVRSAAGTTIVAGTGFVSINPGARPPVPDWDVNMDGNTSLGDLGAVSSKWSQQSTCKGWIRADVNNSSNVSLADIGGVTSKWGQPGFQCAVAYANPCPE